MATKSNQYPLRFNDKKLRQQLEQAAKKNGRSVNGEINVRLDKSFTEDIRQTCK